MTDGRASSPLRLIEPRESWVFAALLLTLLSAIGWAAFGEVTTTRLGVGTLMSKAGTGRVTAADTAIISGFTVERGEEVDVNQVVALLELPALERQIGDTEAVIRDLQRELSAAIDEAPQFDEAREVGDSISSQYAEHQRELAAKLETLSDELQALEHERERRSKLRTPFEGHVFERNLLEGTGVEPGDTIMTVAPKENGSSVIAFVSQSGGLPSTGASALVLPHSLEPTEFGYIKATVKDVSMTPKSRSQILRYLRSEALADTLIRQGEPYRVELELIKNPDNPSGLEWTLGQGPSSELPYGTLCDVEIMSRELSPLQLAFPALRD